MFAPQPDGSAVTFWGDPARTASELRDRSAHDADAFGGFDAKMRSIASFLAYVNVATPPDAKSPSIADAMMGLKLGKAFRDLGGKTGREAIRALPMAVADLVQEVFDDEAVRGPLDDPRRALHVDGPVGDGHRGHVPERLCRHRRRRGGHHGVRPRRHRERSRARSRPPRGPAGSTCGPEPRSSRSARRTVARRA